MVRRAFLLLVFVAIPALCQQTGDSPEDLAPGRFLVASRKLADPNFAETVILLIQYDEEKGGLGLVVNRPSDVPLSRVLSDVPAARNRSEFAYSGGPVERGGARVLLRAKAKPEETVAILRGVYLLTSTKPLQQALAAGAKASDFRAYLGYAGWGPGQLEMETEAGAWHILRADPGSIFDPDPGSLWSRLVRETERSIARLFLPPGR